MINLEMNSLVMYRFTNDMLVFVDETGTDRRDSLRRHGYSIRGRTPQSCKVLVRGERISIVGIMTYCGVNDLYVVRGSVDDKVFWIF